MRNSFASIIAIILAFSLSACGGGDGGSTTSTPPAQTTSAEGLWTGTTNTGRTVAGLVLDDGAYWFLYSLVGNPSAVAGVVQGSGTSQNGSFASSNTRDFNLEGQGIHDGVINGSYVMKQTLNGTLVYANNAGQVTFTTTYDADYDLTPNASLLVGTYTGSTATNGGIETVTVTLSASGLISGSSISGCTFTGSFAPRSRGNVYDVSVTFAGGVCSNGTNTVTGIGFFDAATKKLYSAALNNARTNGFLFIGTKP